MRPIFPIWYGCLLILVAGVFAAARIGDGGLHLLSFEGDALHLADIVARMQNGEVPHRDFMTPLGIMAFLPITALMDYGLNLGSAFAYAPVLIFLVCLPAVWWSGVSRLSQAGALAFGLGFLVMLFALLHGGVSPTVTVSMYYNNWCWAVAMPVVALSVLDPTGATGDGTKQSRRAALFEALCIGAGMAFLVMTKATFAVFLAPAVILALIFAQRWMVLAASIIVALVTIAGIVFPVGGLAHLQNYVGDLLTVAQSPVRASPGKSVATLLVSPALATGALAVVFAVLFMRQALMGARVLVFLALGVGYFLVSHQNWQHDPHWMVMFGLLLFPVSADVALFNKYGWPLKPAIRVAAIVLLSLSLPLMLAQAQSLLVHSGLKSAAFAEVFTQPNLQGFRVKRQGADPFKRVVPMAEAQTTDARQTTLNGEILPDCKRQDGLVAAMQAHGSDLNSLVATKGKSAIYGDWLGGIWLFSGLAPLRGGAPWFYGGDNGFENADYVVVPLCPMGKAVRRLALEALAARADLEFSEVGRTNRIIVMQRIAP